MSRNGVNHHGITENRSLFSQIPTEKHQPFNSKGRISMKNKFTITELLVVISIISILVSLLLPVLGSARKKAKAINCIANLKSCGLIIQDYADSNNGWWVALDNTASNTSERKVHWSQIVSYAKSPVFEHFRKQAITFMKCTETNFNAADVRLTTYSANINNADLVPAGSSIGADKQFVRVRLERMPLAERTSGFAQPLLGEAGYDTDIQGNTTTYVMGRTNGTTIGTTHQLLRHKATGNFIFSDGHAEMLNAAAIIHRLGYLPERVKLIQ